jgi:high-affinity nickel permease
MSAPNEHRAHRPSGVSSFFVYQATFMAIAFWVWLVVLAVRVGPVSGWHLAAAAGAITTTMVGVALGVRHAAQANAAARHEQIMRTLVELSWQPFTVAPAAGDADVIPLAPHESRPRPRR